MEFGGILFTYFSFFQAILSYPGLFNMDYEELGDERAGIPVRRCYGWIENQQCSPDEICIHYQGQFIECVPDSKSGEFDLNQGDIMRKVGKRSGKRQPRNTKPSQTYSQRPKNRSLGVSGSNRQHRSLKYALGSKSFFPKNHQ